MFVAAYFGTLRAFSITYSYTLFASIDSQCEVHIQANWAPLTSIHHKFSSNGALCSIVRHRCPSAGVPANILPAAECSGISAL